LRNYSGCSELRTNRGSNLPGHAAGLWSGSAQRPTRAGPRGNVSPPAVSCEGFAT